MSHYVSINNRVRVGVYCYFILAIVNQIMRYEIIIIILKFYYRLSGNSDSQVSYEDM